MKPERVIWQYWETRGEKPAYIDGLHRIAARNAGVPIVCVTPETLKSYLPDIEDEVFQIAELAHKADMIRARLVQRHGGMWLDSDAVVLSDLAWLFDLLDSHEFVGFNNGCRLQVKRPWVRVNCFLSRPNGTVVSEWVRQQNAKFPQTVYRWAEIGAQMLNGVCLEHPGKFKLLPFESICPVPPKKIEDFLAQDDRRIAQILSDCFIVMLTNRSLLTRGSPLPKLTVEEIAAGDYLLSAIMQSAIAGPIERLRAAV